MRAPKRFYLVYAPPGMWNAGPNIVTATMPDILESYKEDGWTIEGPFALVGTRETGESRRSLRDRLNGGWHKD